MLGKNLIQGIYCPNVENTCTRHLTVLSGSICPGFWNSLLLNLLGILLSYLSSICLLLTCCSGTRKAVSTPSPTPPLSCSFSQFLSLYENSKWYSLHLEGFILSIYKKSAFARPLCTLCDPRRKDKVGVYLHPPHLGLPITSTVQDKTCNLIYL